jgi:hypothetical protein
MQDVHVGGVVEVLDAEKGLAVLHSVLGEGHGPRLLVHDEIAGLVELVFLPPLGDGTLLQAGDDLVDLVVLVRGLLGGAADDEGRARLVDEMESTSSTMAKWCPRCTMLAMENFMLSRR